MRAAIGCVSLYQFGYPNFARLAVIFDRILPQKDPDFVKFTSVCIGKLINHPSPVQIVYVSRLFQRSLGWIRARGRRSRLFAAIKMIRVLSAKAGICMIGFMPAMKTAFWDILAVAPFSILNSASRIVKL
jgi:hypothetical protein